MDVEQTRRKTYYDYHTYGPVYCEEKKVVFFRTLKEGDTKIISSFYRGPYTILEIFNNINFRVKHNERKNNNKFLIDRMKEYPFKERLFFKTKVMETGTVFERNAKT